MVRLGPASLEEPPFGGVAGEGEGGTVRPGGVGRAPHPSEPFALRLASCVSVSDGGAAGARTRREPPPFRPVVVHRVERLSPRMTRLTLAGPDLEGLAVEEPAASVRLLLPSPDGELVMPSWNGNEFLLPDGRRPPIRTFTPRRSDPEAQELDLEIVVHGHGVASEWAEAARPGETAAVSGPGRGYPIDRETPAFLLAGDETAIPAISQLLEALPGETPVRARLEVAVPAARLPLPPHPSADVEWFDLAPGASPGDALVAAVVGVDLAPGTKVWVAGEAAAVHRVRQHLFRERGLPRAQASVRGYWKHGRSGGGDEA